MKRVAILGAGPAGMATALQLCRFQIPFVLLEKNTPGGLLKNASKIENYLGFPQGISNTHLVDLFVQQLSHWSIDIIQDEILQLDYSHSAKKFLIKGRQNSYLSEIGVVATGTLPKTLSLLENLPPHLKKHTSYEIFHLLQKTNQTMAILGAGDAALDYSLNLGKKNRIYILGRSAHLKGLPLLVDRVQQAPAITLWQNTSVLQIEKGNKKPLLLTVRKGDESHTMEIDHLVSAVGRRPNKDFYAPSFQKQEEKLISQGLLYLPGDIQNDLCRQVSIAVGDGIRTAMKIWKKN